MISSHGVHAVSFIVSQDQLVAVRRDRDSPASVQGGLGEYALLAEMAAVVDNDAVVLTGREQVGQAGVEMNGRDVVFMAGEGLNAGLGLVVPHADSLEVRDGRRKRFLPNHHFL